MTYGTLEIGLGLVFGGYNPPSRSFTYAFASAFPSYQSLISVNYDTTYQFSQTSYRNVGTLASAALSAATAADSSVSQLSFAAAAASSATIVITGQAASLTSHGGVIDSVGFLPNQYPAGQSYSATNSDIVLQSRYQRI